MLSGLFWFSVWKNTEEVYVCAYVSLKWPESVGSFGAGAIGICKQPNMDARTWTLVLCKIIKQFQLLSWLSSYQGLILIRFCAQWHAPCRDREAELSHSWVKSPRGRERLLRTLGCLGLCCLPCIHKALGSFSNITKIWCHGTQLYHQHLGGGTAWRSPLERVWGERGGKWWKEWSVQCPLPRNSKQTISIAPSGVQKSYCTFVCDSARAACPGWKQR